MIASSTSTPATIIEINSTLVITTSTLVVSFDGIMCSAAAAKRDTMSLFETSISCRADSSAYCKDSVEWVKTHMVCVCMCGL